MSDITISYKGSNIATMDASGTKTLLTEGKYCEDDIDIAYIKPSGGGGLKYSTGTFTVVADTNDSFTVQHSLGEVPNVIIVWTEDFTDSSLPSYETNTCMGFIWLNRIIPMDQWTTTNNKTPYSLYVQIQHPTGKDKIQVYGAGTATYVYNTAPTSTAFTCKKMAANTYYRTGVTYKYIVAEKWW